MTPDLFTHRPPLGPRDGKTFIPAKDEKRLNRQAQAVWDYMIGGDWHTLAEISRATGEPEASVSARLRDFRKARFGAHKIERSRPDSGGLFLYHLTPRAR